MKSREKTSAKYSARSKRTEQSEKVLRIHREKIDRALAEVRRQIADLEEATRKLSSEMADSPNGRTQENLQRGLADIDTKRSLIKIYEQDGADTEAQIQKLVPSPEQARERLEGQRRLERLAGERLEKDLQADRLLEMLSGVLRKRLELGAEMANLAASLDIRLEHDGLDDSRFKELLYSLPDEVSGASKRWLASFILGMPEGAKPYVVCDEYLEVRETLAHHGIYRAGEPIHLTEEQARELLRRDRPDRDTRGDWLPPSIVTLEEYQAAQAEAKKNGIGVDVALSLVQWRYELEEKKRRADLKNGGQMPVPITQLAPYDTGRQ
jgi:hypothetical protein